MRAVILKCATTFALALGDGAALWWGPTPPATRGSGQEVRGGQPAPPEAAPQPAPLPPAPPPPAPAAEGRKASQPLTDSWFAERLDVGRQTLQALEEMRLVNGAMKAFRRPPSPEFLAANDKLTREMKRLQGEADKAEHGSQEWLEVDREALRVWAEFREAFRKEEQRQAGGEN